MSMWTAREYAPVDRRTIPDGPSVEDLLKWREEAATWLTAQMHQAFRKSEFASIGNFNATLFEQQVLEVLAEATNDVFEQLED
jgi:hypothetical protein